MTLERISAFITYCIAVLLAWLGDLSLKDASTVGGMLIGVLMLAINWYYRHKSYQLLRDGKISRGDYESFNR
ncbi:HP1 family phage holin [Cronobacter sakazakii]|uniref:HP1 family phage holin n=1 Tax=Cronobacter sakazakii TaxID=28141 RepID=UPI000CFBDCCA|nr:HP1 family phage holin [Cronobacter sakazakii]